MHKHLKRVIHPNRNLIWAVAIALIATFALVSYIAITDEQQNSQYVFVEVPSMQTLIDSRNGFTVRFPNHWDIERDEAGSATGQPTIFNNPSNLAESITVSPLALSQEASLRKALIFTSEQKTKKGTTQISWFTATTAKDKTPMRVALIKTPTKFFYIHGNSSWFDNFVSNFTVN